jgi:hypothetical protein
LIDAVSGIALDLKTGVPCYQVEDEEGRIHLLIHLPIEASNFVNQLNRNRFEEAGRKTSAGYKNSLFLAPHEFSVFVQLRAPLVAGPF